MQLVSSQLKRNILRLHSHELSTNSYFNPNFFFSGSYPSSSVKIAMAKGIVNDFPELADDDKGFVSNVF